MLSFGLLLALSWAPLQARAFSFALSTEPFQCSYLNISWSEGVPPYEVTVVPLENADSATLAEVIDTNTTSTSWEDILPYPNGTAFLIVLSDATGFGTGGVSDIYTVGETNDTSCLPVNFPYINFTMDIQPYPPIQCATVGFLFDGSVDLPLTITAAIPGGDSWVLTSPASFGTSWPAGWSPGMNWTVDVPAGTQVVFIAGDQSGRASGGWSPLGMVGSSSDASCLDSIAYTTTASPAAGAINTSPASSSSGSSSSKGSIAGGVIGGFIALLAVGFCVCFLIRRRNLRRRRRSIHEKAIGLRSYPFDGYNRDEVPRGFFGSE